MKYILQCDGTVEGIFSAVYSAWELKYGLDQTGISIADENSFTEIELFATYVPVERDSLKAEKVLRTLRREFGDEFVETVYYAACSSEPDRAETVFQYIRLALQKGATIRSQLANPCVLRMMELNRNVGNERHHYLGFLRFIELPNGILLARYEPHNNITELLLPHFEDRLSGERFVIWDVGRKLIAVYEKKHSVMVYLSEEQEAVLNSYTEDNLPMEDLWKTFVNGISIASRENKALQQNNIPLRYRTYMPEFTGVKEERTEERG